MSEQSDKAGVRDLEREDLPAVGRLFQKTFRKSETLPPSLVSYLHEVFFDHPWYDEELRSKVFIDGQSELKGFIGVFPSRLELEGRSLRAAFAGTMMVDRPAENPLVGARLLRSFLAGPQDLSLTETANALALGMWQKLALPLDLAYSLNWIRVFRPVSAAVQVMEKASSVARLLRPIGRMADGFGERTGLFSLRAPIALNARRATFKDATRQEFADAVFALKDLALLRPQWDRPSFEWFMEQAEQKRAFGKPSWRIAVARNGEIAGCYVYYGKPGGIAWLLQALCSPAVAGELVDDLFAHADTEGCAGVRGGGHPWLTPELISRKAVFYGRAFFVAHAKDKSLLQPVNSGQALISGLAGENWTRLIGDHFD